MNVDKKIETSVSKIRKLFAETGLKARIMCDEKYGQDFEDIAVDIGDTFDILDIIINKQPPVPENILMGATMNWGALNSLISAVELLRLGYYKEPMTIIRNAVEYACVAHCISIDELIYKKFMADPDKFDSPSTISEAKKIIEFLGPMYGLLSKYTHPGGQHILPHDMGDGVLYIGGYLHEHNPKLARLSVIMTKQAVNIICSLIQFPSVWNAAESRYWKIKPDGKTCSRKPSSEKMVNEFKEMSMLLDSGR